MNISPSNKKEKELPYSVFLPESTKKRLEHYCQQRGLMRKWFLNKIILESINREEAKEKSQNN